MYRAALYTADLSRLGRRLLKYDKRFLTDQNMTIRIEWRKLREALKNGIPNAESTATRLGLVQHGWKTRGEFDSDLVVGKSLTFRSRLTFAACTSYGNGLDIIVLPVEEDWHRIGILHSSENAVSVHKDKEKLDLLSAATQNSSSYGTAVIEELMTNGWGIVAVSPNSFDSLSIGEKNSLQCLVARNSAVDKVMKSLATQPPPSFKDRRRWRCNPHIPDGQRGEDILGERVGVAGLLTTTAATTGNRSTSSTTTLSTRWGGIYDKLGMEKRAYTATDVQGVI